MKVSIVIPVYNVEKYLRNCLISVMNQTYRELEIILVNDGSTDNSGAICSEFASMDNRIKLVTKNNGGLADARNKGIAEISGDYVAFVDSDDILALEFVEVMTTTAYNQNADIIECNFMKFVQEKEINYCKPITNIKKSYNGEQALKMLFKEELKQVVWNKMYRAHSLNGILFEKGRLHEDEFWTYQVIGKAKKIVKISDVLYFYRQQEGSIMGQQYSLKRLDAVDAFIEQVKYTEKYFPSLKNIAVLRLFSGALYNLQKLSFNRDLDADNIYTKKIIQILKKYILWEDLREWGFKQKIWAVLFILYPQACVKLRNFLKINI